VADAAERWGRCGGVETSVVVEMEVVVVVVGVVVITGGNDDPAELSCCKCR
jgi:hypothetical protein